VSDIYKPHPSDNFETPDELFEWLDALFHFEMDICANRYNHKCKKYISPEENSFDYDWDCPSFMNPPYRQLMAVKRTPWMQQAADDAAEFKVPIVCLVKAATETKWFDIAWRKASLIMFFSKRIRFVDPETGEQSPSGARFPNALLIFGELKNPGRYAKYLSARGTVVDPEKGIFTSKVEGESDE